MRLFGLKSKGVHSMSELHIQGYDFVVDLVAAGAWPS
jgi:hypothetical protein